LSLNKFLALLVLASSLLLVACEQPEKTVAEVDQENAITVTKSPNDSRTYEYRKLDSGLEVLLISDPSIETAAVSLNVKTGSKDDPETRPGLAHFVEHMLFLGTKKYPAADDYQQFLSDNAGSHNAYTAFENTNYFFDIKADQLEPALDRFSRFFIDPLLQEEYVEREKNAVHSEYKAYIKSDARRYLDVLKEVTNPRHPFSKFTVGNLDTLAEHGEESLRSAAVDFYQQYYSANAMSLVVLGKEPVDELAQWVKKKFAPIRNRHLPNHKITTPLFDNGMLPLRLDVAPVKEVRSLAISFPVGNPRDHLNSRPLHLIGDILGHEGEGSLYQYLQTKGWAESLSAGIGIKYNGGGLFGIKVELTEAGLLHVDDVAEAIFYAVSLVREQGVAESRFDQQQLINRLNFEYLEQVSAVHYVMDLSSRMGLYQPKDILQGPYSLKLYDQQAITSYLNSMRPENALVSVIAPQFAGDTKSKYYSTPYTAKKIAAEQIEKWNNVTAIDDIKMPASNNFIPQDFSLVEKTPQQEPSQLEPVGEVELWYGQSSFDGPRGAIYLQLNNALVNTSPKNSAMSQLLVALLNDSLNSKAYPARLVGFSQSVSSSRRGIQITTGGYNDKQEQLLELVLTELAGAEFSEDRFVALKQQLVKDWRNSIVNAPSRVLMQKLSETIYLNGWSDDDLIQALQAVELEDVLGFSSSLMTSSTPTMLVYGNFSAATASAMAEKVDQVLVANSNEQTLIELIRLPKGKSFLSVEVPHNDAATVLYMQAPTEGYAARAKMGITSQVLKPAYFNSLRTEQQFGYIVYANVSVMQRLGGMVFIVQSPTKTPAEIEAATREFFKQSLATVQDMTVAEYSQHQQSLIAALSQPPQNLAEEAGDYWYQLIHGYDDFELDREMIAAINSLDLTQWQQFYQSYFFTGDERSLLLVSGGKTKNSVDKLAQQYRLIDDVDGFKQTAESLGFK
jgi:secreted Zn-dependent insulinase-like peptidase